MVSLRSAYFGAADDLRTSGVDKEKRKRFKAAVTQGVDPDLRRNRRFLGSNSGVSLRNARDRVGENGLSDSQRSEMALRVKAKIYERISRGELPQESEHVLVDFGQQGVCCHGSCRHGPAVDALLRGDPGRNCRS